MSWGYKIILILVVFTVGIMSMVVVAMRQTNEVMDNNYYERELRYQQVINGKKNLESLADTVRIAEVDGSVQVFFPEASINKLDSGSIEFLRMSNSTADQRVSMDATQGSRYQLPRNAFAKGYYKVRIAWLNNGTNYYHEQDFQIH